MIPRTFPSTRAANGEMQMVVFFLGSVAGLQKWVDYIPVRLATQAPGKENNYDQNGYINVTSIGQLSPNTTPFKDYVPVFIDNTATDAWTTNIAGYIPVGQSTFGGVSLGLDFTTTTTLNPRITFSRTSNATVTGPDGTLQWAPHNLLTFSEQFDNAAWTKFSATITANSVIAPNGTITADKFTPNASSSEHSSYQNVAPTSGVNTISLYAKADGYSWVALFCNTGANAIAYFNLSTGVVGTVSGSASVKTATITPVSDGWYRCVLTATAGASTATGFLASPSDNTPTYLGNGTSGIFIWGAQLEQGSTATTYNPTTVKNLLGFTEHFDNAAWTKSNAFVQTNLLLQSEAFDTAIWVLGNATVTANALSAPDGTTTADMATITAANAASIRQTVTVSPSTAYTFSFYVRRGTATSLKYSAYNVTGGANIVAPTDYYVDTSDTQWTRISFSFTTPAGCTSVYVYPFRDGASTGTVYFWGAQLVQGTSAGDYKATYAAAAAVGYPDIYGQPFAQKLVENTATANHEVSAATVTIPVGTPVTYSVFAKASERGYIFVALFDTQTNAAYFNLNTGAVVSTLGGATANITAVGNGWYRCAITRTASGNVSAYCRTSVTGTSTTYTGDGTSGIYIFGAQLSDSASVDPYVYNPVAAPASTAYYGPRFDYDPVTLQPKGLLIEEQRTNLLTYSEQFDNASWGRNNLAVTANSVVAPNGTTAADTITATASAASGKNIVQSATLTGQSVFSVYAKQGTHQFIQFFANSGTFGQVNFDLLNGTLSATTATGSITAVGNGWYRCTAVFAPSITLAYVAMVTSLAAVRAETWTSVGTETVQLWGAQLEAGAFATSYIPTTSAQVTRAADSASIIGNNFARWYNQTEGTFYLEQARVGPSATILYATDNSANNVSLQVFANASTEAKIAGIFAGAVQYDTNTGTIAQNTFYKLASAYKVNDVAASLNGAAVVTDATVLIPAVTTLHIGSQPVNNTSVTRQQYFKRIAYYPRRLSNSELQAITV